MKVPREGVARHPAVASFPPIPEVYAITDGDSVTVPMQMTEGGIFGTMYDPDAVIPHDWGTLEFSFSGCWAGHVTATPNQAMLDLGVGFEAVDFDITRLTSPTGCP